MRTNRRENRVEEFSDAAGSSSQAIVIVVALALAASLSSLGNSFALDDVHIIAANGKVHGLSRWWELFGETYWPPEHGASLYRPLTMLAFALQWVAGSGSPTIFHGVNVALYVLLSAAVLLLARQLMPARAALIAAAVFAVHPLHVEAFANVVGQAELWVALLVVLVVLYYLRVRSRGEVQSRHVAAMCCLYAVALAFKEHAIVLPGLIAAAEVLFVSRSASAGVPRLRKTFPLLASMFLVACAFLVVRTTVIGQFAGGSTARVFQGQPFSARVYTMLEVFPEWVRLFFWPVQLSANYSPPRIQTVTSFDPSMLPAIIALIAIAVIGFRIRKEHPGAVYPLAFAGIALLIPSNLVVVTGFVLAERALLLGSVGVALAVGYGVFAAARVLAPTGGKAVLIGTSSLLVGGIFVSASRGPVWKDNETLFRQTVRDVPTSYRAHLMLGELLTAKGNYEEGLVELAKAVSLSYPQDVFVRRFAAERFHAAGLMHVAKRYYEEAIAIDPSDLAARHGLANCLYSMGDNAGARATAISGFGAAPIDPRLVRMVHAIDSAAAQAHDSTVAE